MLFHLPAVRLTQGPVMLVMLGMPGAPTANCLQVRRYWPKLPDGALVADYSGVRPKLSAPGEPAADFQVASYGKPDPEMTTQHQVERKPRGNDQIFSVSRSNRKTHIWCCCPELTRQKDVKNSVGQPLDFLSIGIPLVATLPLSSVQNLCWLMIIVD